MTSPLVGRTRILTILIRFLRDSSRFGTQSAQRQEGETLAMRGSWPTLQHHVLHKARALRLVDATPTLPLFAGYAANFFPPRGMRMKKVVPRPFPGLSAQIAPPCSVMNSLAM